MSILNTATADEHRGLVSVLPELLELLHDAGLYRIAERCVEYAQFVSDVAADGFPGRPRPGDEDGDEEADDDDGDDDDGGDDGGDDSDGDNDGDGDDDGSDGDDDNEEEEEKEEEAVVVKFRQPPTHSTRRRTEAEIDSTDADSETPCSGEDTECEEQPVAETEPAKIPSQKMVSTDLSASKKRKKQPSGVLPQRKSVRQWNRIPDGGESSSSVNAEWALI